MTKQNTCPHGAEENECPVENCANNCKECSMRIGKPCLKDPIGLCYYCKRDMNYPQPIEIEEWENISTELENEFNTFIRKWTEGNYQHLLDTDENDGSRFRKSMIKAISLAYQKGLGERKSLTENLIKDINNLEIRLDSLNNKE